MSARPSILIADDDPAIRALLTDILTLEGCHVIAVEDGERALEALELSQPDLVILDVMMPGRSGLEVLRVLRSRPETRCTPVLIVSAKCDDVSVWEGMRTGCDFYVTKPFDPSEVVHHVQSLLGASAF
jgi:DNA-binding response OmpR family regulator